MARINLLKSAAICTVAALGACSGAGTPFVVPAPHLSTADTAAAQIQIQLSIAADTRRAHSIRPEYFSPSTRSLKIYEQGKLLGIFAVKLKGSACQSGGGTVCVFSVQANTGKHRIFTIDAYDKANGKGHLLSSGKVVKTIGSGTTAIAITLGGRVAKVEIALENPNPPAGTAVAIPVVVMAKDADGHTIVGPGRYSVAIALSDDDSTGATTLSAKKVTSPNQDVTLNYDGRSLTSASVAASAKGAGSGVAAFGPIPTVVGSFELPTAIGTSMHLSLASWAIALGSDGNLWLSAEDDNAKVAGILSMTPSGHFTTFVPGTPPATNLPNDEFSGLVKASDGNVWYLGISFDGSTSDVGKIAISGAATNYPFSGITGACPGMTADLGRTRIIDAADGGLWFTAQCTTGSVLVHATTGGSFKVNTLPSTFEADGLVLAADGKIYIAGFDDGTGFASIVRATTAGNTVTATSMVDVPATHNEPLYGIVQTHDGDLWATNEFFNVTHALVRLHLGGGFSASSITQYQTLAFGEEPAFPIVLKDGTMWIPESNVQKVTQLETNGKKAPKQLDLSVPGPPTVYPCMWDVAEGTDSDLYFNSSCRANGTPDSSNVVKVAY